MSVFDPDKTALITGAASGVGLAIAQVCSRNGMRVVLVDKHGENLSKAVETLKTSNLETHEVDVSSLSQWQTLKSKVLANNSHIDLLVLNAGISLKGSWYEPDYFRTIMDVNLFGQVYGLNTFLDTVRTSKGQSAVVMVGSKQGITNPPGNAAYNASKAAIKTLAEHLSFDLRTTSTSVHLLIPGWTFTGLSGGGPNSTKAKPDGAWYPSQVADKLVQAIEKGEFWVICPDNDVSVVTDKKRMLWSVGDAVYGRPPLSRWREETKASAQGWIDKQTL